MMMKGMIGRFVRLKLLLQSRSVMKVRRLEIFKYTV